MSLELGPLVLLRLCGHTLRVTDMGMKTILVFLLGVVMLSAGCGDNSSSSSAEENVVAAFYPLAFAAERIGGHGVEVTNLTPPGVELMALVPPGYSTPFHKKMFSPGRRPATEK